tara:strand:- start:2177 stop:2344 length:168 start_codon:yes stop_codon:yes gene_type:complete
MAPRKNVKRIDPRYFLDETATRGEDAHDEVPPKGAAQVEDQARAPSPLGAEELEE